MKKLILLGLMGLGAANVQAQWSLTGNTGTNPPTNFIGTTDNKDVVFKRNNAKSGLLNLSNTAFGVNAFNTAGGSENTAIGIYALYNNNNDGSENTATGYYTLYANTNGIANTANGGNALRNNTSGIGNTAVGYDALYFHTTGYWNTAVGLHSLYSTTTAVENTAIGTNSLYLNTTGNLNTSVGSNTLYYNTDGIKNTAVGGYALYNNTSSENTAAGYNALYSNTSGSGNTANGVSALESNTTGYYNTATGILTLRNNTTGAYNTAGGNSALNQNTTGQQNTATGDNALARNTTAWYNTADGSVALANNTTGQANTAVGYSALVNITTGSYNTAIGAGAGPTTVNLTNTTALGYGATPLVSNQVWLGNSAVTSVRAGASFTIISDGRFKTNIKENVSGLEFINKLKPVTYNYKIHELNSFIGADTDKQGEEARSINEAAITAKEKIVYTGFVAQEVEKAAEKVGYNFSGVYKPQNEKDPYGLNYSDFVVPLVKAVQELSAKNEEKQNEIKQLNDKLKSLEDKLNTLLNSHSGTTEVNNSNSIVLDQNAPNPFAESTVISYSINEDFGNALISISDNNGVVIKTYAITAKGKAHLTVYGNNLSAGVYHYSLIVDGKTIDTKTLVKN